MKVQELFEANADISTQAGLVNFLKDNGFQKGKTTSGTVNFFKFKNFKKAISDIKKVWSVTKTTKKYEHLDYVDEVLELNGIQIRTTTYKDTECTVKWDTNAFKNPDKTDIYKITKHHPAWAHVLDMIDQAGAKGAERKKVTKEVVDDFMKDNDLDEAQLKAIIVKRTKENKVHHLYGTD